jgi:glycosyltransferase involved in cell wall biosynthesis
LPQIHLLGARPYESVPGYLQHADVVIVPHRDTPFTQSLDPIKAYECLAIETPTVATPVAGFRELADAIAIAPREEFITTVRATLSNPEARRRRDPPGWEERVEAFEAVLLRAHHGGT